MRVSQPFTYIGDVGFGNSVFVVGNHADVGNWNPTNAIKLRWTAGNIWTGQVAIQAGTALQYKFIRRSTDAGQICSLANTFDLGATQSLAVAAQPAAPYAGKTILYHSMWGQAFIQYRSGTNWVSTQMTRIGAGRTNGEHLYRLSGIGEAGEEIEFVPNDGNGQSDNPVGGGNYQTSLDTFFLQDKNVFNYQPPTNVSTPTITTTTVNSTYGGIPSRTVRIYLPRGYAQNTWKRYPVLYFHDGQNVFDPGGPFGSWSADATSTREAAQGRMRECILVGVDNTPNRIAEYMPPTDSYNGNPGVGNQYLNYLVNNVRPYINSTYRTLTNSANTLTAGSSLGGLISLYAGREGTNFGKIGIVSPAFWVAANYMAQVSNGAKKPARVYLDMGTAEGGDAWNNYLGFYDVLLKQGYAPNDDMRNVTGCGDQHNEAAWKKRLPVIFRFLLNPWDEPNSLAQREHPPKLTFTEWNAATNHVNVGFPSLFGFSYELEQSSDLASWSNVTATGVETLPWGNAQLNFTMPAAPQKYWRLRAMRQ